jgi:hypothetical protein
MSTVEIDPERVILPHEADLIEAVDKVELMHPPESVAGHMTFLAADQLGAAATEFTPYNTPCSRQYTAKRSSGKRPLNVITLGVFHSTQGWTAAGAAAWFHNPTSQGSAHRCNDDNVCFRTLDDNQIPWGAPGANYIGLHYEQAGFAQWSEKTWLEKFRTLRRTALKAAQDSRRYGIKIRWLSAEAMKSGVKNGFTDHDECSKAFGGSHWDPGPGWPRKRVMGMMRAYALTPAVRRIKPIA